MSNLICGNIICGATSEDIITEMKLSTINYCKDNGIGLHFAKAISTKSAASYVEFRLSDNFDIYHCENFLEPIIYTEANEPILDSLLNDLDKLYGLLLKIFSFGVVDKVELRFSYVEVDESEYKICEANLNNIKQIILSEYLSNTQVPVVKAIIHAPR